MTDRPPIFVIAADDSTEESKRKADRVMRPGETLDEVIDFIWGSEGGVIQLTEGHFELNDWPIPNRPALEDE